ncbi:MAG: AgmX/PglI C-terminal domain-containing protein, partial [Deltaproteobacteria bacterium]|nr:AgmX/PglI C-terminal domain-containing protein [Kofleriaceae bacterium]
RAASAAAPPSAAVLPEKVYDFSGESLTAGAPPSPPSTAAHTVLTKSAIRAALSGARADVLACYESALARTPDLAGTITVRVVIEGEPDLGGVISDATISDASTITDAALSTCILDAIVSLDLPAPDEGTIVTVHYPFVLSPR